MMVGALVAAHVSASAQDFQLAPVFDVGVLTNTLSMDHVTQSERARAQRSRGGPMPVPARAFTPGPAAVQAMASAYAGRSLHKGHVEMRYAATASARRQALGDYVSRIASQNPAAAKAVSEQFSAHDMSKIYRGLTMPFGLRDDDVADLLTAYTVLGWLIATGAPDPSPADVRVARGQIAAGLAADRANTDLAMRAGLGEELKLLFLTLHAGWQSARREGNLRSYSDNVAAMLKEQTGRDLRGVRLTSRGFSGR